MKTAVVASIINNKTSIMKINFTCPDKRHSIKIILFVLFFSFFISWRQISVPIAAQENTNKSITINFLLGKIKYETNTHFTLVQAKHQSSKRLMYIDRDTYQAFQNMAKAAKKSGINLSIVSAARNFDYQKTIWENKWLGKNKVEGKNLSLIKDETKRASFILRYSAMPGTSRHHWGTDIDLNSVYDSYFTTTAGKKVYKWLTKNAPQYGFCQTYTAKNSKTGRTGYEMEKWHWSYIKKSKHYLQEYNRLIQPKNISGFAGDGTVDQLNIIENFVNGINPTCK